MIDARTYGYGPSSSMEINRIALDAASAATVAGGPLEWLRVPDGGVVGPRNASGYCLQFTAGFTMRGETPDAVIYQGGVHAGVSHQLFQVIAGSGYRFEEISFDGSLITPKPINDQNHLFNVVGTGGPVHDVRFTKVGFRNAGSGQLNTGDGFRCVGASASKNVSKIRFESCTFFRNGRADITPIYNTDDLSAYGCTFDEVSDRAIGIELTVGTLTRIGFKHCYFNSNRSPGVPIVSLAGAAGSGGNPDAMVDGATFDHCFFGGGGFFSGYARNVRLSDCTIRPEKAPSGIGAVTLVGLNENVLIERTTVEHFAEQGNVPSVLCYPNSGIGQTGVTFRDVKIFQGASAHVVELQQTERFSFERCALTYSGAADNATQYGMSVRTLGAPITSLSVTDTTIAGSSPTNRLQRGIGFIVDTGRPLSGVSADRLTFDNVGVAFYTPGAKALYADEPQFRGATLGPGVTRLGQSSTDAPIVCLGGERGNGKSRFTSGWGTPEGVVLGIIGNVYERRDNNTKYYKSTGTPVLPTLTGWVLVP